MPAGECAASSDLSGGALRPEEVSRPVILQAPACVTEIFMWCGQGLALVFGTGLGYTESEHSQSICSLKRCVFQSYVLPSLHTGDA